MQKQAFGTINCPLNGGKFYCVIYRECPLLEVPLYIYIPVHLANQVMDVHNSNQILFVQVQKRIAGLVAVFS